MPIYEYVCRSCGHETEILHKISDPPATECPQCREPDLVKMVSAVGFRLSGGGWYETDFKKDGKRNLAGERGDKKESAVDKPGSAKQASKDSGTGGKAGAGGKAGDTAKPKTPAAA